MKNLGLLSVSSLALSLICASTSFAASYTVTINNRTTCHLYYSIGDSTSKTSVYAGKAAEVNVPAGQQLNLYMFTTLQHSYPACGYQGSTASILFYYDSTQKTYVEKVHQGATISGARPYYQKVTLEGTTYTVNGGDTVQKNVNVVVGTINTNVYGGNLK